MSPVSSRGSVRQVFLIPRGAEAGAHINPRPSAARLDGRRETGHRYGGFRGRRHPAQARRLGAGTAARADDLLRAERDPRPNGKPAVPSAPEAADLEQRHRAQGAGAERRRSAGGGQDRPRRRARQDLRRPAGRAAGSRDRDVVRKRRGGRHPPRRGAYPAAGRAKDPGRPEDRGARCGNVSVAVAAGAGHAHRAKRGSDRERSDPPGRQLRDHAIAARERAAPRAADVLTGSGLEHARRHPPASTASNAAHEHHRGVRTAYRAEPAALLATAPVGDRGHAAAFAASDGPGPSAGGLVENEHDRAGQPVLPLKGWYAATTHGALRPGPRAYSGGTAQHFSAGRPRVRRACAVRRARG